MGRAAGRLAKPPGGSKARPRKDRGDRSPNLPSLADQGVDKDLAKAAHVPVKMDVERKQLSARLALVSASGKACLESKVYLPFPPFCCPNDRPDAPLVQRART
jgi:hypothetical protein